MRNFLIWFVYRSKAYVRGKISNFNIGFPYKYVGKVIMSSNDTNQLIKDKISEGTPFLAARFGATELLNMQTYDFGAKGKYDANYRFQQLCDWSGFFPNDSKLIKPFVDLMKDSCGSIDLMGVWYQPFEDYYIKKYMKKDIVLTSLNNLEPWIGDIHWSSALKGKKVLLIHPFEETILTQYKKRGLLFKDSDILPEFELKTLKAVQTLAGNKDDRFETWFDAMDFMYNEAMQIDFDIAIIGCGAFGLPLAAKIKKSGKQAIHLAGATQILFGIKGKRWEETDKYAYVRQWFNDAWVYPSSSDVIENAKKVENGCYW